MLELQRVLLRRSAEITGGRVALCEYLGVSDARLELWLAGRVRIPDPIFLRAVDLVLRDDIARASVDRRQQLRNPDREASLAPSGYPAQRA